MFLDEDMANSGAAAPMSDDGAMNDGAEKPADDNAADGGEAMPS